MELFLFFSRTYRYQSRYDLQAKKLPFLPPKNPFCAILCEDKAKLARNRKYMLVRDKLFRYFCTRAGSAGFYQTHMKKINQPQPAWRACHLYLKLTEAEFQYLQGLGLMNMMSIQAYIRSAVGLEPEIPMRPTLEQRIQILRRMHSLMSTAGINTLCLGDVPALVAEAEAEIARRDAPARPVGRPRKPESEPTPADLARWAENADKNEVIKKLKINLPLLPTNREEDKAYKASQRY